MPSKHTQLPSALASTPLLPVARGGAPSPRPSFGAARGDLEATFRRPHDPPRRPGREFASGEGAEKVLIEANDRGWTIVGEHLLESRRLADISPSVRRRPPPLHLMPRAGLHPPDGVKTGSSTLQEPSSRDRATAWLREEAPSFR